MCASLSTCNAGRDEGISRKRLRASRDFNVSGNRRRLFCSHPFGVGNFASAHKTVASTVVIYGSYVFAAFMWRTGNPGYAGVNVNVVTGVKMVDGRLDVISSPSVAGGGP